MQVLITGATGLIGSALIEKLVAQGDNITALTRYPERARQHFSNLRSNASAPGNIQFISNPESLTTLNQFNAVINLAGEPIASKRWSTQQKARIETSRWTTTNILARLIKQSSSPPSVFISGSAIGYYGRHGNAPAPVLTENSPVGCEDYSHKLCAKWEDCALQASSAQTRVVVLRTGIVLAKHGGALKKMYPQFQFGLGGKIGDGKHYMSWIHLDDMVGAILHLLNHNQCSGVFNLTAPNPVTNAEFARLFANTLTRPSFLTTPAFVLQLMFGEMADLLTYGHNVLPNALLESGYEFQHATLESGLKNLYSPKRNR